MNKIIEKIKNMIDGKLNWSMYNDKLLIKILNANISLIFNDCDEEYIAIEIKKYNDDIKYDNTIDNEIEKSLQINMFDIIYSHVCSIKRHPFTLCENLGINYLSGFQDYLDYDNIGYTKINIADDDNNLCMYSFMNRNLNLIMVYYDKKDQDKLSSLYIIGEKYDSNGKEPLPSILISSMINYLLF